MSNQDCLRLVALLLMLAAFRFARGAEANPPPARDLNPHAEVLREAGVSSDRAGIERYLRSLTPDARQQQRIDRLTADLGHADFSVREQAMAALTSMPQPPLEALSKAAESDNYEVSWRAKQVVRLAGGRGMKILYSALATIQHDAISGLTEPVLAAFPHCTEDYVREAAIRALLATAREDDAAKLRGALADDDASARRGAAGALCKVLGNDGAKEIAGLLESADEGVCYEAARALADLGDRRSLPALLRLLDADDVALRALAAGVLRAATGQSFGFAAYDPAESRRLQTGRWREWLETKGETVELRFPLADRGAVEVGRTLIALYTEHRVIEIDESGRELREIKETGLQGPWGATRLPNGNVLINWFSSHTVIEYAPDGKEVWRKVGLNYPWSAERLANGNTLIACNDRVIEVSPGGETVWEKLLSNHVADAHRLANGNTLALVMDHSGSGKAIEVDPSGAAVWQLDGLAQPYRVQRLESGNTLITLKRSGVVVEYDRAKTIVWKLEGLSSPDSAQRLANGRTLVSDASGVREFDSSGRVVWEKKLGSTRSISWRY